MKLIVVQDRRGGIGKDGDLLVSIPTDMKHFRTTTSGGTVIMGRKTLESFPGAKPLPKRKNIVISTTMEERDDCIVVRSIEDALAAAAEDDPEKVFLIGGGQIYRDMMQYCDEAIITELDAELDADTFIPVFAELPDWERVSLSETIEENGFAYAFAVYRRK